MVDKKLRYGLIGCGRISSCHIEAVLKNRENVDLVAVCDVEKKRAESLVGNKKIIIYKDYKEMIKKEELDLVAIATDSGSHASIAIDCLNAGINVIVEKPMALSIDDADKMIRIADEKGLKLCVSFQNRFNKPILKLREAHDGGRFGKLFFGTAHIRWNRDESYYKGTWREKDRLAGGALMNQCIHNIDLLCWMMGDVKEVFAYTDNLNHPYVVGEDFGLALLKFKNSKYGLVEGSVNTFNESLEEKLCIFGEKGTVKIGGEALNKIDLWKFADKLAGEEKMNKFNEEISNVYGHGHVELYRDMIDAITSNRKPLIDGVEGKKALEVVLAIYRSAKEGRPVSIKN